MPSVHWPSLYEGFDNFVPAECLNSLDWSGNQFPEDGIDRFCSFFFASNPIKFVAMDRIFKGTEFPMFDKFIRQVPKGISGVSLGGDSDSNFSGSIKVVVQALDRFPELRILHLNGQKLGEMDLGQLQGYVQSHRSVAEISFDDTAIFSETVLADSYKLIQNHISIIGRPFLDFKRFQSAASRSLEDLQSVLQKTTPGADARIR